ncbi:hypothetical protein CANCADRAFT_55933 [Tortispora caseinolytica NRRL Y-17796]|uniref:Major facilitator superfamily (MFS) profile domain-containing protein n=1 Tax=Tortispora caseinolytica NRRL Y-17796 TaxID=767744 RepID=A0A1E4TKD5_9ASCO|nr:hypothetical protein CANCADRAFT_55933 [Tortispora caseinolytica NRRL Y-17796]
MSFFFLESPPKQGEPRDLCFSELGFETATAAPPVPQFCKQIHLIQYKSPKHIFFGILFLSFFTSLDMQVSALLLPYAASSFSMHSMIAMIQVIQSIVNAVIKAPIAKFAGGIGLYHAFLVCIALYSAGHLLVGFAKNRYLFCLSQILYAFGNTGLAVLIQLLVVDATKILHRAKFAALPYLPFLVTVFVGPWLADLIIRYSNWRLGYIMFAVFIPLSALPLVVDTYRRFKSQETERALPDIPSMPALPLRKRIRQMMTSLDIVGCLLFTASLSLLLLPVSLPPSAEVSVWNQPSVLASVGVGLVFGVLLIFWESNSRLAPQPLFHLSILKNPSLLIGSIIGFCGSASFALYQPYLFSYVKVTQFASTEYAGRVCALFPFFSTISGLLVSLGIQYTGSYKRFILAFSPLAMIATLVILFGTLHANVFYCVIIGLSLIGCSIGVLNVAMLIGMQAIADSEHVGAVTALFLTTFAVGQAIGSSISGALWSEQLWKHLVTNLPELDHETIQKIYSDINYAAATTGAVREQVNLAFNYVMSISLMHEQETHEQETHEQETHEEENE